MTTAWVLVKVSAPCKSERPDAPLELLMRCTAFRFTALPFTAIGLLTALAIAGLAGGSVWAQQPDATTISVAVT